MYSKNIKKLTYKVHKWHEHEKSRKRYNAKENVQVVNILEDSSTIDSICDINISQIWSWYFFKYWIIFFYIPYN